MMQTLKKKSEEPVVNKSSQTKNIKEQLIKKTSQTMKNITVIGRNVPEGDERVNRISDDQTEIKKTDKKKTIEPVNKKLTQSSKNITLTEESNEKKKETTDKNQQTTQKDTSTFKKAKKILK